MKKRSFGMEINPNRRKADELSTEQRSIIIDRALRGEKYQEIADDFGINHSTVKDTLRRWRKYGTVESLPRTGRPKALTHREERKIIRIVRKAPKLNYQQLFEDAGLDTTHQTPPHRSTLYRLLKKQGLTNRRCATRPKLKEEHVKERLRFEKQHRDFDWSRRVVKFSDECSVQRGSGKIAEWCFRFPHEKYDPNMITEKEKGKQMSQMVWGAIWVDERGCARRSELVIMDRDPDSPRNGYSGESYIKTLQKGLLPNYRPGQIFVQDNARIHVSKKVQEFIMDHGIWVLEWPPYSPDLNPIEHLWWALKKKVHELHPELETMGDSEEDWEALRAALKEAWRALPNSLIKTLICSMPNRLAAVRKAKGWQTKY